MDQESFRSAPDAEAPDAGEASLFGNTKRPTQLFTPEEFEMMKRNKRTHREDGQPRVDRRDPVRTFRASDATWELVQRHADPDAGGASAFVKHAIERHAKEVDRQKAYAAKKPKKRAAARAR